MPLDSLLLYSAIVIILLLLKVYCALASLCARLPGIAPNGTAALKMHKNKSNLLLTFLILFNNTKPARDPATQQITSLQGEILPPTQCNLSLPRQHPASAAVPHSPHSHRP
ncbi:hypothetical protein JYB88_02690 [Shewanella cyperi]|uniref:Uncharacterized protein n=1 Tax=Shewanella cyperi TaxID=2814292 RepID=A0A975ALN6_9GAMM|nr:hypothetical protein [Shewanella cyperi]QSX30587.1 hypothetical protein JYB88_02690 [Shewanella cyperi]